MPGIFLVLTIVSGFGFAAATGWVILQWSRADREVAASERDLQQRVTRATEAA